MKQLEFSKSFVSDSSAYQMNIQSAGVATIPIATLSDEKKLYIEFAYHSEGEDRNGKMTLLLNNKTGRFEGNWKTVADNGDVYQGKLYFVFGEDDQAKRFYRFKGANYRIMILKK
ncbi:MAG: hypothetical protein AAF944_26720 [Bacteroidota bacterium]